MRLEFDSIQYSCDSIWAEKDLGPKSSIVNLHVEVHRLFVALLSYFCYIFVIYLVAILYGFYHFVIFCAFLSPYC